MIASESKQVSRQHELSLEHQVDTKLCPLTQTWFSKILTGSKIRISSED